MAVSPADYRPSLAALGAIMRARTVDSNGDELGTFTADTRPTDVEAESAVDTALGLVSARLGDVPEGLAAIATALVTLRAGMLVETGHFPQDATPEESAYAAYREQYRDALADYDAAVQANVGQVRADLPKGIATVRTPTIVSLESDAQRAGTTLYPPAP